MAQMHEDLSRAHQVKVSSNSAFGWVFVAVFLIIALWPMLVGGAVRWWSLAVGAAVAAVTLAAPALLTIPNRLWQRFGALLNRIVSPVVLAIMFYLVVTPMGLLMRVFAKQAVRRGRDPGAQSYWIKREPPGPKPDSMGHQF